MIPRPSFSAVPCLWALLICAAAVRPGVAQTSRPEEDRGALLSGAAVRIVDGRSLQKEIDKFGRRPPMAQAGLIRLPKGTIVLDQPLNLRKLDGLTLIGQGPGTVLQARFPRGAKHEARKWPILDLTGSNRIRISDLSVSTGGDPAGSCGCGILEAREAHESAAFHVLDNVHVEGFYNGAALWNAASEVNTYIGCVFTNFKAAPAPTAGGWCAFFGNGKNAADDPDKLGLPYSLVKSPATWGSYRGQAYDGHLGRMTTQNIVSYGASTMEQVNLYGCHFAAYQGAGHESERPNGNTVNIMIYCNPDSVVTDIHFIGGGMASTGGDFSKPGTCSFAAVYFDSAAVGGGGGIENISFEKMRCETGSCKHFLYLSERSRNICNLVLRDNWLESLESTFKFDLVSRSGPILIEGNFITSRAGYDWKSPQRAIYQSVRDIGLTMRGNRMVSLAPSDPTRPNLVYKCSEFSENCTIDVDSADSVSVQPNGTFGLLLNEYWMPSPSSTGGLRRLSLGSLGTPEANVVPNVQILTKAPSDDPVKYKDGDVVFANVDGVYRIYLRGGGAWHYFNMDK
jgi:hypothetical protein